MAEEKKSFLMYCDLMFTADKLSDENAGKLLKHLLRYVNDLNPEPENDLIDIVFEPIKRQLKRDLSDWDEKKVERSLSGRLGNIKRWNPDLFKRINEATLSLEQAEVIAKNRKLSLSDNFIAKIAVNDNVTVNVNGTVNEIKENNAENGFDSFWLLYPKKVEKEACRKIYARLSITDKQKISETLSAFLSYKPFPDYNHPNPKTYLNKKRWNDEIDLSITKISLNDERFKQAASAIRSADQTI